MAAKKKAKRTGSKKKVAAKKPPASSTSSKAKGAGKGKSSVSSLAVNRGHVFSLRPRADASFKQSDFDTAKHFLCDESYATIEAAARAVVEKALELTREGPVRRGGIRRLR